MSFPGEIADFWRRIRKPIFAYYLGDYDPSGFDLERDLRGKRYGGRYYEPDPDDASADNFVWQRLIDEERRTPPPQPQRPARDDTHLGRFQRPGGGPWIDFDRWGEMSRRYFG